MTNCLCPTSLPELGRTSSRSVLAEEGLGGVIMLRRGNLWAARAAAVALVLPLAVAVPDSAQAGPWGWKPWTYFSRSDGGTKTVFAISQARTGSFIRVLAYRQRGRDYPAVLCFLGIGGPGNADLTLTGVSQLRADGWFETSRGKIRLWNEPGATIRVKMVLDGETFRAQTYQLARSSRGSLSYGAQCWS